MLRRLDELLLAHPWWYATLGAGIMFALFLGEWPLPAAAVAALAVFVLIGWSWSKGPSRKAYDEREGRRAQDGA